MNIPSLPVDYNSINSLMNRYYDLTGRRSFDGRRGKKSGLEFWKHAVRYAEARYSFKQNLPKSYEKIKKVRKQRKQRKPRIPKPPTKFFEKKDKAFKVQNKYKHDSENIFKERNNYIGELESLLTELDDENKRIIYEDEKLKDELKAIIEQEEKEEKDDFKIIHSSGEFGGYSFVTIKSRINDKYNLDDERTVLNNYANTLNEWIENGGLNKHYKFLSKRATNLEKEKMRDMTDEEIPIPKMKSIVFSIITDGEYDSRKITLDIDVLGDLSTSISEIRKGDFLRKDKTGSDVMTEQDEIDLSTIRINFVGAKLANKKLHNSKFWDLRPLPKDYHPRNNCCTRILLKQMYPNLNIDDAFMKKNKCNESIETLIEYIKSTNVRFCIVDDWITSLDIFTVGDQQEYKKLKPNGYIQKIKCRKYSLDLSMYQFIIFVKGNHVALVDNKQLVFGRNFNRDYYNVITQNGEEMMTAKNTDFTKLENKLYESRRYVGTHEYILDKKQQPKPVTSSKPLMRYIFFDFEGINDFKTDNITRAYSCSFIEIYSYGTFEQINLDELKKKKLKFTNQTDSPALDTMYINFDLSYECAHKLANVVMNPKYPQTFTYLIGFNSQAYDNYIIYNAIKDIDADKLGTPFYSGNKMLNFSYNGSTRCFDVCRFASGRLSDICKSFKIDIGKLHVNHTIPQYLFDVSPEHLINEMKKVKSLEEYNNRDVEVLVDITSKLAKVFDELVSTDEKEIANGKLRSVIDIEKKKATLLDNMTLPGYVYSLQKKYLANTPFLFKHTMKSGKVKEKKEKLSTIYDSCKGDINKTNKYYDLFMSNKSGGRVQLFGSQCIKIDKLDPIDIKSSYPNAMCVGEYYYPIGKFEEIKPEKIDSFISKKHDGMYFVLCDVDESKLKYKMLCKKEDGKNNWEHDGLHKKVFISCYQKNELEKRGGVCSNYTDCIYYANKILGTELFKPILTFMLAKDQQDIYKNSNDTKYNPALREMAKLCMNALSGKYIERLHLNKFIEISENSYRILESTGGVTNSNIIDFTRGNKAIMNVTCNKNEYLNKMSFCQIGFMIYVYSKQYLYDQMELTTPIYCDTDSLKIRSSDYLTWSKKVSNTVIPHTKEIEKYMPAFKDVSRNKILNGSLCGAWENENGKDKTKINYFLDKKMYLTVFESGKTKMTFKGVGSNSKPLISKNGSIIKLEIDKKRIHLLKSSAENDHAINMLTDDKLIENAEWVVMELDASKLRMSQLSQLYEIARPLSTMCEEVFEKLYNDGCCDFLVSGLRRNIKNTKKHRDFVDGELVNNLNCIIRTITYKKIKIPSHPKIKNNIIMNKTKKINVEVEDRKQLSEYMKSNALNFSTYENIKTLRQLLPSIYTYTKPTLVKHDLEIIHDKFVVTGNVDIPIMRYDCIYATCDRKEFKKGGYPKNKYFMYRYYLTQKIEKIIEITSICEYEVYKLKKDIRNKGITSLSAYQQLATNIINKADKYINKNASPKIINRSKIVTSIINKINSMNAKQLFNEGTSLVSAHSDNDIPENNNYQTDITQSKNWFGSCLLEKYIDEFVDVKMSNSKKPDIYLSNFTFELVCEFENFMKSKNMTPDDFWNMIDTIHNDIITNTEEFVKKIAVNKLAKRKEFLIKQQNRNHSELKYVKSMKNINKNGVMTEEQMNAFCEYAICVSLCTEDK